MVVCGRTPARALADARAAVPTRALDKKSHKYAPLFAGRARIVQHDCKELAVKLARVAITRLTVAAVSLGLANHAAAWRTPLRSVRSRCPSRSLLKSSRARASRSRACRPTPS